MTILSSIALFAAVAVMVMLHESGAMGCYVKKGSSWIWGPRIQKKRTAQLEFMLPATLQALANALGVSGSLTEAISDVASEELPPVGDDLKRVLKDTRLGMSLDEALAGWGQRYQSPPLNTVVAALRVGKQTGGDLAHIAAQLAHSLREIKRLEGMAMAKTAEGRGQAWVMGMVPPVLVGLLQFIDPTWLLPLWDHPLGWALLALCVCLEVTAVFIIRQILAVDI